MSSQSAAPVVLLATSVQLPALLNDPVVGELVKLTVPVGALAPLDAVSFTITMHVVALPSVGDAGEQSTVVDVESTVTAGELAVTDPDWPLLVLCVLSPW